MRISPDIRPNCGETGQLATLGPCFQNYLSSSESVRVFFNTTKVLDYNTGSSFNPLGIDPYKRKHNLHPSDIDCYPADELCCQDTPSEPCCELPTPTDLLACLTSDTNIAYGHFWNCFTSQPAETESFVQCFKQGFKNAYAKKNWLGTYAYSSPIWEASDAFDYCCACETENYKPTSDTTKYLAVEASATRTETTTPREGGSTFTRITSAEQAVHVNRYSGELISDTCFSGSDDPSEPDLFADKLFGDMATLANDNILGRIQHNYCGIYASFAASYGEPISIVGGGNAWTIEWQTTDSCGTTFTSAILEVDVTAGTLRARQWGNDGFSPCPNGPVLLSDETWVYSGTIFSYTLASFFYSESITGTTTETVAGSLSSPYTSDQAYQDACGLLNKFPLDDDNIYQWRTDGAVTRGPLLQYDETDGFPALGSCDNANVGTFTGEILGLPLPAGYQKFWNPTFENWKQCTGTCGDGSTSPDFWFIDSYGNFSSDDIGIACATNWVTRRDAVDFFPGGWVAMNWRNQVTPCNAGVRRLDDVIYVGKEAQIQVPRPSVNYARPCASDRFLVFNDTASCIQSFDPISKVLLVQDSTGFSTHTTISLCGLGADNGNGLWPVLSVDSNIQLTLGQPIYTGSQFTTSYDCGTGVVAQVRFPHAPGLCGRDYITSYNGSPLTCSLEDQTYLFDDDEVVLFYKGQGADASKVLLTNEPNVIILKDIPSSSKIPDYIVCPFTADWKWNDSAPKGDYTLQEYIYDYRGLAEYNRLLIQSGTNAPGNGFQCNGTPGCAGIADSTSTIAEPRPFVSMYGFDQNISASNCSASCNQENPCSPKVIAILPPNAPESFLGGHIHYLPNSFKGDATYGNLHRKVIKQHDIDPFWQAPPCACRFDAINLLNDCFFFWEADPQANCTPDDDFDQPNIHYYAYPPLVEARCSPPLGSPPLPQGSNIGCLTVPQINIATTPQGNLCEPSGIGEVDDGDVPWIIWTNQLNCICNDGRFADKYADNVVTRPTCEAEFGI